MSRACGFANGRSLHFAALDELGRVIENLHLPVLP